MMSDQTKTFDKLHAFPGYFPVYYPNQLFKSSFLIIRLAVSYYKSGLTFNTTHVLGFLKKRRKLSSTIVCDSLLKNRS